MKTIKAIGVIFLGLITITALSYATDFFLESIGMYPPFEEQLKYGFNNPRLISIALIYRSIYGVVGCFLAASLSPGKPMRYAMIVGAIGLVLGTMGSIAMWHLSPAWYQISLLTLVLPSAWLGGTLAMRSPIRFSRIKKEELLAG
ncbi:hypothetical protein BH09BAC3_BH09BAC3_14850 [soil metagenome]